MLMCCALGAAEYPVYPGESFHLGDGRLEKSVQRQEVVSWPLIGREWLRRFRLEADDAVRIRIKTLKGIDHQADSKAGVWLNQQWLGTLTQDHNQGGWVSERWVELNKNDLNVIRVVSAAADDADDFLMSDMVVETRQNTRLMWDGQALLYDPPRPYGVVNKLCSDLKEDPAWPYRGALIFSVLSGKRINSRILTFLEKGESYPLWFRIPSPPGNQLFTAMEIKLERGKHGSLQLVFAIDQARKRWFDKNKSRLKEGFRPQGYIPGQWCPLVLNACWDGQLEIDVNYSEISATVEMETDSVPLILGSEGVEVAITRQIPLEK